MTDKEAILQRHSVRSYEDKKIDEDVVRQIKDKIEKLNLIGDLHLQFIEDADRTESRILRRKTCYLFTAARTQYMLDRNFQQKECEC